MNYRRYSVSARHKAPLLEFMLQALQACKCRILSHSSPETAPFRVTFEAPDGERLGIVAYAFFANSRATRNRPGDEYRFQVKYGPKTPELHTVWQDPFELYTTLFLGIDPQAGIFVGADPVLHSPTRFFISIEFKASHVAEIQKAGWTAWERTRRVHGFDEPVEVLVGGTRESFLGYVRFERAAKGMDAGHRGLLADKVGSLRNVRIPATARTRAASIPESVTHGLAREFELTQGEILDLIQSAPRLKMAVRGWIAEVHLTRYLERLPGISDCCRIEEDGRPDVSLSLGGSRPLLIECKNVLRIPAADGTPRLDFQRTRASKEDSCSRYYEPADFDVVAACLHPCTEHWEFCFATTDTLDAHRHCPGRLSNLVRLDERWDSDALRVLGRAPA